MSLHALIIVIICSRGKQQGQQQQQQVPSELANAAGKSLAGTRCQMDAASVPGEGVGQKGDRGTAFFCAHNVHAYLLSRRAFVVQCN